MFRLSCLIVFVFVGGLATGAEPLPIDLPAPAPPLNGTEATTAPESSPIGVDLPAPEIFETPGGYFGPDVDSDPDVTAEGEPQATGSAIDDELGIETSTVGFWGYRRYGFGFRNRFGYGYGFRRFGWGGGFRYPFGYASSFYYRPYLSYYRPYYWGIGYGYNGVRHFPNYSSYYINPVSYTRFAYSPIYRQSFFYSPSYYRPVSYAFPSTYYYGAGSYGSLYYNGCF